MSADFSNINSILAYVFSQFLPCGCRAAGVVIDVAYYDVRAPWKNRVYRVPTVPKVWKRTLPFLGVSIFAGELGPRAALNCDAHTTLRKINK